MSNLRNQIIRLAHANPELRPHLVPLLRTAGAPERFEEWWEYLDPGSQRQVLKTLGIRKTRGWDALEWEKLIDYFVRVHEGNSRGWHRGRNVAAAAKLDSSKKTLGNRMLIKGGLDGNTYFKTIGQGWSKVWDVLGRVGIEMDQVVSSHLLSGDSGRVRCDIAFTNEQDSFSPQHIGNSVLIFTFHKMQSGRFECIAYLS